MKKTNWRLIKEEKPLKTIVFEGRLKSYDPKNHSVEIEYLDTDGQVELVRMPITYKPTKEQIMLLKMAVGTPATIKWEWKSDNWIAIDAKTESGLCLFQVYSQDQRADKSLRLKPTGSPNYPPTQAMKGG